MEVNSIWVIHLLRGPGLCLLACLPLSVDDGITRSCRSKSTPELSLHLPNHLPKLPKPNTIAVRLWVLYLDDSFFAELLIPFFHGAPHYTSTYIYRITPISTTVQQH